MKTSIGNNLRKAAVLVAAVDANTAEQILAQLPSRQATLVRHAADGLDDVTAEERRHVLEEFMQSGPHMSRESTAGVKLDRLLAQKLATSPQQQSDDLPLPAQAENSVASVPFQSLQHASGDALAPLLSREHPQTIAVILSHLPAQVAAEALARLHPRLQAMVAHRLVDLDETDPEILREIENELENTWQATSKSAHRRSAGVAALQSIFQAACPGDRKQLLDNLTFHDKQLANVVAKKGTPQIESASVPRQLNATPKSGATPFPEKPITPNCTSTSHKTVMRDEQLVARENVRAPARRPKESFESGASSELKFVDLTRLDDQALRALLTNVHPELIKLALIGANRQFVTRVLALFPAPHARVLRNQFEKVEPIRLSDVEQAQREIAELAAHAIHVAL